MRAFVALELPDAFREETAALARSLGGKVAGRFLPQENYHVTLAFLGDVAEQDAAAAVCAVEAACTAAGPVPLEPVGLGTFGRARDATLFLELAPAPGIMGMAERLRGELQGRGVAFDEKPFRPHVTIARRAQLCSGDLGALALPDPTLARCMTLFKSMLASAGAQYKPLFSAEVVAAGAASEGEALASGALKKIRS